MTSVWNIPQKYQHCTNVLLGDKRPETVVYGVDISPIQPCYAPLNCIFQIDDSEGPWDFRYPFDFVRFGNSNFSFKNFGRVLQSAYDSLKPGGWVEFQEMGPIRGNDKVNVWWNDVVKGANKLGYDWEKANGYEALLREKDFKNFKDKRITWQICAQNCKPKERIAGRWLQELLAIGLASFSLVPLTDGMGYTYGESLRKIEEVKEALHDRNTLASIDMYVIPYPIVLIFIHSQSEKNRGLWSEIEHSN